VGVIQRVNYVAEGNNQGWQLIIRPMTDPNGTGPTFAVYNNSSGPGGYILSDGTTTWPAGQIKMIGGKTDGVTRTLYVNLNKYTTTNVPVAASNTTSGIQIGFNNDIDSGTLIACAWNRALSDAEFAEFYLNPGSFLTSDFPFWVPQGAAVVYAY